jgi:hypothetical protein
MLQVINPQLPCALQDNVCCPETSSLHHAGSQDENFTKVGTLQLEGLDSMRAYDRKPNVSACRSASMDHEIERLKEITHCRLQQY